MNNPLNYIHATRLFRKMDLYLEKIKDGECNVVKCWITSYNLKYVFVKYNIPGLPEWNPIILSLKIADYNVTWRLWSLRPSIEESKAVPWNG